MIFLVSLGVSIFGTVFALNEQTILSPKLQLRGLQLGQLNFLHTTDTHGWYGSHETQPQYNANWGDFVSFTTHMRQKIHDQGLDLLIVDTGDKHDGNGLSDATVPNGIASGDIFNSVDYDLLTIGNHELYFEEYTVVEYEGTVKNPKFKEAYVCSNVEYIKEDGDIVPFGNKFRYFVTPNQGLRVLAFGFLFNFPRHNSRARVTALADEVQKEWFMETVHKYKNDVDVIVVIGHLPVTDYEYGEINALHQTLRNYYGNITIQYFGGHSHIRDFVVLDEKAVALQSGRFSETVGFGSISDVSEPVFFRRYIDFNKRNFEFHSNSSRTVFDTPLGLLVSDKIKSIAKQLQLDTVLGHVPKSYYMSARPYPHDENIYSLLTEQVLPQMERKGGDADRIIIINTGSIRYDLHKGNFTTNTEYIVSPFNNIWESIQVPLELAVNLESFLNDGGYIALNTPEKNAIKNCPFVNNPAYTMGYTTRDDFGCDGDDTPHNTERQYRIPNVVAGYEIGPSVHNVTVVFYNFIKPQIIAALNELNNALQLVDHEYNQSHASYYGQESIKDLLRSHFAT